jgi:hypothetical protein
MRPPASPQVRFLLRGSGLFILLLALWWWVLLSPMLAALRLSTSVALWMLPGGRSYSDVVVQPNGDWLLRVPLPESLAKQDAVQRAYGRAPGAAPVTVHSFRLTIADYVPRFFLLGFPLFWALVLAAPRSRQLWRVLAIGSGLLAVLAQLSLLFYAGFSISATLRLASTGLPAMLFGGMEYLNVNVVPYVVPLLLAAWLHSELRAQIFDWGATAEPVAVPASDVGKSRRGRNRGK